MSEIKQLSLLFLVSSTFISGCLSAPADQNLNGTSDPYGLACEADDTGCLSALNDFVDAECGALDEKRCEQTVGCTFSTDINTCTADDAADKDQDVEVGGGSGGPDADKPDDAENENDEGDTRPVNPSCDGLDDDTCLATTGCASLYVDDVFESCTSQNTIRDGSCEEAESVRTRRDDIYICECVEGRFACDVEGRDDNDDERDDEGTDDTLQPSPDDRFDAQPMPEGACTEEGETKIQQCTTQAGERYRCTCESGEWMCEVQPCSGDRG